MDGGVPADRFLGAEKACLLREDLPSSGRRAVGRDFGGTRFGQHHIVWVSNRPGGYMLDLVKVAARKRRYAQNV